MPTPRLSVLIPTYGRSETIARLLESLKDQTIAPEAFEVVVVDDGSPEPIRLDAFRYPFALTLLRQENAGPGAARNAGVAHCRAPWTVILNDDAVPANDLLERHLLHSGELDGKIAVLGTFRFTAAALQSPFVQVLAGTDLLFDFPRLKPGQLHGWTFFWTCNIGLPTQALRDHPFDAELFREPICEDVELGYRLEKEGWRVLHDATAVCEHDHVLEAKGYFRRMVRLGVNMARMHAKHRDPHLLHMPDERHLGPGFFASLQQNVESFHTTFRKVLDKLASLDREHWGKTLPREIVSQAGQLVRQMGTLCYWRGLLLEKEGNDPFAVCDEGPKAGELVSIVAVSFNALAKTQLCVEALRAAADPRHPTELVFVDNGSTDGSAEWLAEQPDVRLVRNTHNEGAPHARNQGLALARGRWIVVMDNDALVTPGWLARLLHHAQVDGRSGCVGPVSNRAAHGQEVPFDGPTDPASLAAHAEAWAEANYRKGRPQNILTSFLLLFRREVLDTIGGFDERFSPWGFEDDDFTLRAALAGFRNRVAVDVFVRHETYDDATKSARHNELLARNWARFSEKWAGRSDVPYGDYKAIEPGLIGGVARERLYVPLRPTSARPAAQPAAPFPAATDSTVLES
ncbi:MAG: glycosyltransferase [Planctomycetaceae bacterium]|nr:glycosyltransferase [Planctomycetaceae bacterium]